jgi:hypothetical protein
MRTKNSLLPFEKVPSTFPMTVDDISKITLSEQKLLWI